MNYIKTFIKGVYYAYMSLMGCGCSVILFLVVLSLMFGSAAGYKQARTQARCGLLAIDLSMQIDEAPTQPDMMINYINGTESSIGVLDLSDKIAAAAQDPLISGIVLTGSLDNGGASFSQTAELRRQIEEFKASGKPVYAYLENPTQSDYYLASAATRIFANNASTLEFKGMRLKSLFIGNALKKYGIDAELVRAGKYKSAGEFFTADKFSPESREVYTQIAEGVWKNILSDISKSRNISEKDLKKIAAEKALLSAADALKLGLVDTIGPRDFFERQMMEAAGGKNGDFNRIDLPFYTPVKFKSVKKKSVAVLFMDGQIVEGNIRKQGYITSDYYASIIRDLRNDPKTAGVVLRINSPGGSAFASEIIRREIELLAEEKPVVASFGATAASGAYWISAGVKKIYSEENTLTGSIGVFGMVLSGDKLAGGFGLTFDSVETSPLADIMSGTRAMTEQERAIIQALIDKTYDDFLRIVYKGRGIPMEKLEGIAQGKVWLASAAKNTGLFDEIGGLQTAVDACVKLVDEPGTLSVRQYPAPETLGDIFANFQGAPLANIKKVLFPREISEGLKHADFKSPVRAQSSHIIKIED